MPKTATYELGLTVAGKVFTSWIGRLLIQGVGRAKLWVDGKMTIDNWTKQTAGDFFYGYAFISRVLNSLF